MESRLPRRLTVILHADVVDYSRLSGKDEDLTHRSLQESLRLISTQVTSYHGRIANTAGDAVLAMFDSVADALSCAIAIQENLAKKSRNVEADKRLLFRIGIHLGDVIEEGSDIFGDGRWVATRRRNAAPWPWCRGGRWANPSGGHCRRRSRSRAAGTACRPPRPLASLGGARRLACALVFREPVTWPTRQGRRACPDPRKADSRASPLRPTDSRRVTRQAHGASKSLG